MESFYGRIKRVNRFCINGDKQFQLKWEDSNEPILSLNSSLEETLIGVAILDSFSGCVAEATVTSTGLATPGQLNVIPLH